MANFRKIDESVQFFCDRTNFEFFNETILRNNKYFWKRLSTTSDVYAHPIVFVSAGTMSVSSRYDFLYIGNPGELRNSDLGYGYTILSEVPIQSIYSLIDSSDRLLPQLEHSVGSETKVPNGVENRLDKDRLNWYKDRLNWSYSNTVDMHTTVKNELTKIVKSEILNTSLYLPYLLSSNKLDVRVSFDPIDITDITDYYRSFNKYEKSEFLDRIDAAVNRMKRNNKDVQITPAIACFRVEWVDLWFKI